MKNLPLLDLCQDLTREFQRDSKGSQVASLLSRYASDHQDWRDWAMFDTQCYTRNLVHHEAQFELLLLCWAAGQKSPIHNHEGQRCWMAVLDGGVTETLFHFPEEQTQPGMLSPKSAARLCARNQVAFITDEIALHEIAAAGGAAAVSLHLYSRPFSTCQVYDRETGRVAVRQLSYYSVRGQRALSARPS
ncbi:MAG TPA: cysteine dioxygenase family protein [Planctomycetota bacterium]|nr:cysteine dioxygenase family protein [Planctomycetota bacterium]